VWRRKAAHELEGFEGHDLGLAAMAIILPGKPHCSLIEREEPAVRDGDVMSIAAEIGEHLFRPTGGWLGTDHPVEAA
jgi:hypothetical protein